MSDLLQKALQRCLDWCAAGQKAHAWKLAKDLALIDPHQLAGLPDLLTKEMKRLQGLQHEHQPLQPQGR
jgi:hypothetical protein